MLIPAVDVFRLQKGLHLSQRVQYQCQLLIDPKSSSRPGRSRAPVVSRLAEPEVVDVEVSELVKLEEDIEAQVGSWLSMAEAMLPGFALCFPCFVSSRLPSNLKLDCIPVNNYNDELQESYAIFCRKVKLLATQERDLHTCFDKLL